MMKHNSDSHLIKLFCLIFSLAIYAFIALFISQLHFHEPDVTFHENCPACVWQIHAQDDDTTVVDIIDSITDAATLYHIISHNSNDWIPNQIVTFSFACRAPPALI